MKILFYLPFCLLLILIDTSCHFERNNQTDSTFSKKDSLDYLNHLTEEEKLTEEHFWDSVMYERIVKRPEKDSTYIRIFISRLVPENSDVLIDLNQGEFIYHKKPFDTIAYYGSDMTHLNTFRPTSEKVKVLFRVNQKDSIFYLDPKVRYQVKFHEINGEHHYCTNVEWECWASY